LIRGSREDPKRFYCFRGLKKLRATGASLKNVHSGYVFPLDLIGNTYRQYESDFTFSPKISPYNADAIAVWAYEIIRMGFSVQIEISLYNADVIAVCANKIGPLQISNLSNFRMLESVFLNL